MPVCVTLGTPAGFWSNEVWLAVAPEGNLQLNVAFCSLYHKLLSGCVGDVIITRSIGFSVSGVLEGSTGVLGGSMGVLVAQVSLQ